MFSFGHDSPPPFVVDGLGFGTLVSPFARSRRFRYDAPTRVRDAQVVGIFEPHSRFRRVHRCVGFWTEIRYNTRRVRKTVDASRIYHARFTNTINIFETARVIYF